MELWSVDDPPTLLLLGPHLSNGHNHLHERKKFLFRRTVDLYNLILFQWGTIQMQQMKRSAVRFQNIIRTLIINGIHMLFSLKDFMKNCSGIITSVERGFGRN